MYSVVSIKRAGPALLIDTTEYTKKGILIQKKIRLKVYLKVFDIDQTIYYIVTKPLLTTDSKQEISRLAVKKHVDLIKNMLKRLIYNFDFLCIPYVVCILINITWARVNQN